MIFTVRARVARAAPSRAGVGGRIRAVAWHIPAQHDVPLRDLHVALAPQLHDARAAARSIGVLGLFIQ
jgi:hypothetical protein